MLMGWATSATSGSSPTTMAIPGQTSLEKRLIHSPQGMPRWGQQIRVVVSYKDGQGTTETIESNATTATTSINDDPVGEITIDGDASEGSTLTANTADLSDADGLGTFSYQWQQSADNGSTWTDITGEIGETFVPDDAQVDQQIRVVVSYTDDQGSDETVNSLPTTAITNVNDDPTGDVTITGTDFSEGVPLSVDTSALMDDDGLGTFSYQWQQSSDGNTWTDIDTTAFPDAATDTFTPDDGQVDQFLRAKVTYTDGGNTEEMVFSLPTDTAIANANDDPTGTVTIPTDATEDTVLTAINTLADEDGLGELSYQWQQSSDNGTTWVNITDATSSAFTPGDDQVGDLLRVEVTYTDDGNTVETVTSNATTAVVNVNDLPTGGETGTATKVIASDASASDLFGKDVAISGTTVVVGSFQDDDAGTNAGAAYILGRNGVDWPEIAKLIAADGAAGDFFGFSTDISGNSVIVGAYGNDDAGSGSGSAYIFTFDGTAWTQTAKLTATDAASGNAFGYDVAIDGNRAIIGAYRNDDNGGDSGSAYIFTFDGISWTQTAKINASDGLGLDRFGYSVDISGTTAIVGADRTDGNGSASGSAYIYTLNAGQWVEVGELTASDAAAGDQFGTAVALMAIGRWLRPP
jgi:hypothetical protein